MLTSIRCLSVSSFPSLFSLLLPWVTVVPNLFGSRDQFHGRQFFHGLGSWVEGDSFGMIQVHYIYCELYYYYIVLYNKVIIHLTITLN